MESDPDSGSALVVSLYLIGVEDILIGNGGGGGDDVLQRARLYERLSRACGIANGVVQEESGGGKRKGEGDENHRPWHSGGDGPVFGVHCAPNDDFDVVDDDEDFAGNDVGDDENIRRGPEMRGKRHPGQPHLKAVCHYGNEVSDAWRYVSVVMEIMSRLSSYASEEDGGVCCGREGVGAGKLQCAAECWDVEDGHLLLIEAAESLPEWVDADVSLGGVGGPGGCRNRCWIAGGEGEVHLLPPTRSPRASTSGQRRIKTAVAAMTRAEALRTLVDSFQKDPRRGSSTLAPEGVQKTVYRRMERGGFPFFSRHRGDKDETCRREKTRKKKKHWHVAPVALPASVARYVCSRPELVPLAVDSFCRHAPEYQRSRMGTNGHGGSRRGEGDDVGRGVERRTKLGEKGGERRAMAENHRRMCLGSLFPYERLVVVPVMFSRASYAELVGGRGRIPSFPAPPEYRSVELNRLKRTLWSVAPTDIVDDDDGDCNDGAEGGTTSSTTKTTVTTTRFRGGVDAGLRLCAGLEWIVVDHEEEEKRVKGKKGSDAAADDEAAKAVSSLGETERRIRIHWTRIDADAGGFRDTGNVDNGTSPLAWIERTWREGPTGRTRDDRVNEEEEIDPVLVRAVRAMASCPVFHPELSRSPRDVPCPLTRPESSLRDQVRSGLRQAVKWKSREKDGGGSEGFGSFPMPRVSDVDDDRWMEVTSVELDNEMKQSTAVDASSSVQPPGNKCNGDDNGCVGVKKKVPRRTTRRSRRHMLQSLGDHTKKDQEEAQAESEGSRRPQPDDQVGELGDDVASCEDRDAKSSNEADGDRESGGAAVTTKKCDADRERSVEENPTDNSSVEELNSPDDLMSREVSINPRVFLEVLHEVLRKKSTPRSTDSESENLKDEVGDLLGRKRAKTDEPIVDDNIAKYFFEEDLEDNFDSDCSDDDGMNDETVNRDYRGPYARDLPGKIPDVDKDGWSLQNIMQAMDLELCTDEAVHESIKDLSMDSIGGTKKFA